MSDLASLEPLPVWRNFDALRRVPRPSKQEQRAAALVAAWAAERGFAVRRDPAGNLVVAVPATPGHERAPGVVLQGHLDMVCEKNAGTSFDFSSEPIRARVEDGWVRAEGTTLGADNGIGVAAAMAAAEDGTVHGPLELLFTVDEETGLNGAKALDPALVAGRLLLNLDSEDDAFTIGCAGAADTAARFRLARVPAPAESRPAALSVTGLRGGHSGMSILENPANSLKLLARLLAALREAGVDFDLAALAGGTSRNAVPREAQALLRLPHGSLLAAGRVAAQQEEVFRREFQEAEPGLRVEWRELDGGSAPADATEVWDRAGRDRTIDALLACPHGVLAMSRSLPGLVETSNNLAKVAASADELEVSCLSRSSSMPALGALTGQLAAVFRLAGAEVAVRNGYPAWTPDVGSPLLATALAVDERLTGRRREVKAVHAGLECGILGEKLPGMRMLSFGPVIEGAHTPEERVEIASVAAFYRFLQALLAELAGGE
jgi:dipeptidase D